MFLKSGIVYLYQFLVIGLNNWFLIFEIVSVLVLCMDSCSN